MTAGELAQKRALEVEESQKKATTAVMTGIDSTFGAHFNSELPGRTNLPNSQVSQLQEEAWNRAAYNLAGSMNCDDDRAYIQQNRQAIGMPSTLAVVDGKPFSTRSLGASFASHRATNNNLVPSEDPHASSSKYPSRGLRPNQVTFNDRKRPPVSPMPQSGSFATAPISASTTGSSSTPTSAFASHPPLPYTSHASHPPVSPYASSYTPWEEPPLDGYERVMNHTAHQIALGSRSALHVDVDQGTESIETVVDPIAETAGKRMRYMILNQDIARDTSNVYAALPLELNSQDLAKVLDDTWGGYYSSPEKKART
jgi:hypothetical protein